MLSNIQSSLFQFIYTFPYKDSVEILLIAFGVYKVLLWLKRDTEKNLLGAVYLYCGLFFSVHYLDLHVLQFLLFVATPFVILFFMIIHQETLQKNFVKLSIPPTAPQEEHRWIDELMQCCLSALNRRKEIIIVIERNDPLKSLIHAPYYIYAELKKDIFDILLEKHKSSHDYMIWINQKGKLVAINSFWTTHLDETWITNEVKTMHTWKQFGLFITSKTDVLIIKVNPLTRSFDGIAQGTLREGMNAEHTASFLKKHLSLVKEKIVSLAQEQVPVEKNI